MVKWSGEATCAGLPGYIRHASPLVVIPSSHLCPDPSKKAASKYPVTASNNSALAS